ncbi:dihydrofolate reductase family protein [Segetibacter koreensis]|uniref:dihydrofolate reductase family protein n=1 Tax=Segetibacter koreensis TaxID=398037 RepID=UPI000376EF8B|nr:dihydrofolate reductase family protein [Segetibacter koreensis]
MRKLVLLMHTSLDGFVAGPNGEMDWIQVGDEMFDIAGERTGEADTALYGRVTYQMMENYWPTAADKPGASKHDREHSTWYNSVRKVVVSRTMKDADIANTKIISENIPGEVEKLKREPGKDILILGSPSVVHSLMEDNFINDFWLFVNPILLGQGIPLFKNINNRIKLNLVSSKVFTGGVVCLHYTTQTGK